MFVLIVLSTVLLSCNAREEKEPVYENQVGDTQFDSRFDDANFQFCDSTDVLHKRAFVAYQRGGMRVINEDLQKLYEFKPNYASYSGYFIVRFAVNCKDEPGRYRMQTLDTNFNLKEFPEDLEQHILSIVKSLKGWKHPFYDGKEYDGYKFITIKIVKGKIV